MFQGGQRATSPNDRVDQDLHCQRTNGICAFVIRVLFCFNSSLHNLVTLAPSSDPSADPFPALSSEAPTKVDLCIPSLFSVSTETLSADPSVDPSAPPSKALFKVALGQPSLFSVPTETPSAADPSADPSRLLPKPRPKPLWASSLCPQFQLKPRQLILLQIHQRLNTKNPEYS
jgi:hypothetical protein